MSNYLTTNIRFDLDEQGNPILSAHCGEGSFIEVGNLTQAADGLEQMTFTFAGSPVTMGLSNVYVRRYYSSGLTQELIAMNRTCMYMFSIQSGWQKFDFNSPSNVHIWYDGRVETLSSDESLTMSQIECMLASVGVFLNDYRVVTRSNLINRLVSFREGYLCDDLDDALISVDELVTPPENYHGKAKFLRKDLLHGYDRNYEVFVCRECGKIITCIDYYDMDTIHTPNGYERICCSCLESNASHYEFCDECGMWVPQENYNHTLGCCNECESGCLIRRLINRYDYVPDTFYFMQNMDEQETEEKQGLRYFGLELETDDGERDDFIRELHSDAKENGYSHAFYFMHDGSLHNGVEVTTMPMTLDCLRDSFPLERIYKIARDNNMRAHNTDTCGFHVHVNRNSLGNTLDTQELTLAKLVCIFDLHFDSLFKFSRRKSIAEVERWCDKPKADLKKTELKRIRAEKVANSTRNHYKSINCRPQTNVEFRLFKGTLKPETIIATVDFLNAMIELCRKTPLVKLYDMTWGDLMESMKPMFTSEYTIAYLNTRGLI